MQPSQAKIPRPKAAVASDHLALILQGTQLSSDSIRKQIEHFIREVGFHLDQITNAARLHNDTIAEKIRPMIQARKQRILERRKMVASVGLPIKRREDVQHTYAVPNVRRKPRVTRPAVASTPFVPEPALDEKEYQNILSSCAAWFR